MDFKDYYSTLGVAKTATDKEIKTAYRKMARKHHPDVNPGDKAAETRFKELTEAYEVLGDPDKRKKYDELGANWRMYEQAGAAPGGAGSAHPGGGAWNVNMGGSGAGGGFRTMTQEEMNEMFGGGSGGDADPFSDFFHAFFGGALGSRPGRPPNRRRAGAAAARVSARDATSSRTSPSASKTCNGAMRRLSIQLDGPPRTVDVRIPPGVGDGARVRVAGEGERGAGGGPAGDLFLRIHTGPHPEFERKDRDLYTKVPVKLTQAVLGGEADVKTLGGKSLRLKIPPGTQNGQVFRLKGHGMPVAGKPAEHGDLYATADAGAALKLTPEMRTHFEALKKLESSGGST